MTVALYPGSFDPVHNGHVDVIETAAWLFDEVIVAVGHNPAKPSGMFTPDERVSLIEGAVEGLSGVRVVLFTGLVTVAANQLGARCLVKGIRGAVDLDAEMSQAHMNKSTGDVATVFVPAAGDSAFVSSTYVRQIAKMGGDVTDVVPPNVAAVFHERFGGETR